MKKFTVFLLIICLTVSFIPINFALAEETVNNFSQEIFFLKEAGLLKEELEPYDEISRAQMAKMIIDVLYPDCGFDFAYESSSFADVSSDTLYYSYIKALKDLGIANGDNNNCYNPDRPAAVSEMIAAMVNALGYTLYANAEGGYPVGYLMAAKSTGISKGINLAEENVTFDTAAKILYNSLFACTAEISYISKEGIQINLKGTKNLISDRMGIYEYDAVVTDDGYTSIYGASIEDEERVVFEEYGKGTVISAFKNSINFSEYLGMRVKAFIRNNTKNGKYEVVYAYPHRTEIVILKADCIFNKTSGYYEYDEIKDGSKVLKYKFPEMSPKIIFNGKVITDKSVTEIVPQDGLIKLIDNDGDKRYEIVDVLSFNYSNGSYSAEARNIVVDAVNCEENNEYISCLFNPQASVDLDSSENIYIFKMSGNVTNLSDIKPGDVVSVSECPVKVDGKTLYYLIVSESKAEGIVTSKNGNTLILDDSEEYILSSSITSVKSNYSYIIEFANITLYLDATGKVAYTVGATTARNFGYLINAAKSNGLGDAVLIKLFTKEGEIKTLELRANTVIDGKNYSTPDEQLAAMFTRSDAVTKLSGDEVKSRPVLYKINSEGLITEIDTDTPNHNYTGEVNESHLLQTSIPYTSGDLDDPETLNACWRNPGYEKLMGGNKTINGKFFLTMSTRIIAVPEIDTYGLSDADKLMVMEYQRANAFNMTHIKAYELENIDENYKIVYANELVSGARYDIQAYNIDPDTGVADFAVIRGMYKNAGLTEIATNAPNMIFLRKTQVYDDKLQKNITRIYYSNSGVTEYCDADTSECFFGYKYLIEGSSSDENIFGRQVKPFRAGDIIRVTKDSGNYMTHIERVIPVEGYKNLHPMIRYPTISANRYKALGYGASPTPFDYNNNGTYIDNTYGLCISYVESIKSGIAKFIVTDDYNGKLSDMINGDTVKKNNPFFYINFGGVQVTVVDISKDGKSVIVKKGTLDDIKTLESSNYKLKDSSVVVYRFQGFAVGPITVINGLENVR